MQQAKQNRHSMSKISEASDDDEEDIQMLVAILEEEKEAEQSLDIELGSGQQ